MRWFGRGLRDNQDKQRVAIAPDEGRAIRELIDAWVAASKAHDLPALLAMMTDDVIFMTPGRAPFGKAEFAADNERLADVAVEARAEVLEIETFGDCAYARSRIGAIVTLARRARALDGGIRPERLAQRIGRPMAHRPRRQSRHAGVSRAARAGRGWHPGLCLPIGRIKVDR